MISGFPISVADYRERARRRLPAFLFDYLDGGAGSEQTLAANQSDWARWSIRQRVLIDVAAVDTRSDLLGTSCAMPLALAPVGLAGMMARRGEAQAARVAAQLALPYTLSTVGICGLEEVAAASSRPFWFQLYMLRDRGIVAALLERARAQGVDTLVFTVDLAVPGLRHRDSRHGLGQAGLRARLLRLAEVLARPRWILDVALGGKPHAFGCLGPLVPAAHDLDAFRSWVETQFDASVTWRDIEWLRQRWPGKLLLKGILDGEDAARAAALGADGIVWSNHGGRQLDGAASSASLLPSLSPQLRERLSILVDGGLRSGADVFRALALGAHGVMIGRPWAYALAGAGADGLYALLSLWQRELAVCMALAGVTRITDIGPQHLQSPSMPIAQES